MKLVCEVTALGYAGVIFYICGQDSLEIKKIIVSETSTK